MSQNTASPDGSGTETDFVERDPSGRYGRYKEILGRGAYKKVYKAFDEWEGIEVAWNQVKVTDSSRNSVNLERLYSEVHLLKTLKHKNIIKFYNSWVDTKNEHINFITEIFTSGNLRQYRKKHKHVDVRALKKWSRQILEGLLYLHSHDPPVIHRDLKCDNIFVNGNQGEVKIGDLGLAAILEQAHAAHSVIGTPEFMAPELYEEDYNELVDIYAFGMCLLELLTLEYPYTECANAAQIYKKVVADKKIKELVKNWWRRNMGILCAEYGLKPASLEKVKDPDVRKFIEKCIAKVPDRLSASELLMDPFLQSDEDSGSLGHSLQPQSSNAGVSDNQFNAENHPDSVLEVSRDFMVQGQGKDHNTIFLKLRIADTSGHIRNIHFPFNIEVDTSIDVASEMVEELDLTDQDVSVVATMIDSEIQSHTPDWEPTELSRRNITKGKAILEGEVSRVSSPTNTDSSNPIVMERLPSGRKYWSDSPKASAGSSPLRPGPSHLVVRESVTPRSEENLPSPVSPKDANSSYHGSPLRHVDTDSYHDSYVKLEADSSPWEEKTIPSKGDSDDIENVVKKLEYAMDEHQKELDKLKKKHEEAISDLLKELPQEIRLKVLIICNQNRSENELNYRGCHSTTKSLDQPPLMMFQDIP